MMFNGRFNFLEYYIAFLDYFSGLETFDQVLIGIIVILLAIGIGYMVYGILWLTFQLVKISIIGTILLYYLVFVAIKLLIVALFNVNEVETQWNYSTENMKWFFNKMYPSSSDEIEEEKPIKNNHEEILKTNSQNEGSNHLNNAQIVLVKGNADYFCSHCGTPFTMKMKEVMNDKMICYCEKCGQMFVTPNQMTEKARINIATA